MKKIQLNASKQVGPLELQPVPVPAIIVDVAPFIKAFAYRDGKHWKVCEFSTGLQLNSPYSKTMKDAIYWASHTVNGYGEQKTLAAIATKPVINI